MIPRTPRWVRRTGGRLIRRWGLLPAGDPDGLGDDDALRGQSLPFTVLVFFPDTTRNLYQLRQWYAPLRALDERHRVGIVCMDSRTATAIRAEAPFAVVCIGRIATLDDLVARSDVALALYVNHNIRNFHPLRFTTMLHAYLGHGESDKVSSASNQVKAYDAVLVPGEIGRDRLRRNLLSYDADAHVRLVGRPQLDAPRQAATASNDDPQQRPCVLYAPTWEGAQPSMSYSSVASHGPALLESLLSSGRFRVRYRPHPRLGANRAEFARADEQLRDLLARHARTEPDAGHAVDVSPGWEAVTDPADILISDISAVASDWATTGKPLLVTTPTDPAAVVDTDTVLDAVPSLTSADAGRAADLVSGVLTDDDPGARLAYARRAFGDVSPGASTERFITVCEELVSLRAAEISARDQRLTGSRG